MPVLGAQRSHLLHTRKMIRGNDIRRMKERRDGIRCRCPGARAGAARTAEPAAHYVTAELDADPIIEQDIVRVDHRCSADDLRRLGRHVERAVLARAVGWHLEDRIIVHQNSTIVFS